MTGRCPPCAAKASPVGPCAANALEREAPFHDKLPDCPLGFPLRREPWRWLLLASGGLRWRDQMRRSAASP